ncbi:MAG: twin-arginine translocation signal domain-containing protein [Vicinamibacterales bacterium]
MSHDLTRRDLLKTIGVTGALVPLAGAVRTPRSSQSAAAPAQQPDGTIEPLVSTSEVFIPPRGRSFMKFSYDFPEPSVQFGPYRFGFRVFTYENVYGLDRDAMTASVDGDRLELTCTRLVWAGGQQSADGSLRVMFTRDGDVIEWQATARMDQPIKSVTAVIRGVPRGQISAAGGQPTDPRDSELLFGYPFSAGDLNSAAGLTTPLVAVEQPDGSCTFISSRDTRVRAKRVYLQPGDAGYRAEAIFESEGWLRNNVLEVPPWRVGRAANLAAATADHYAFIETAFRIPAFATRPDAPDWMKGMALALTLHGMHYTGYIFNDYARMIEILHWIATRIPPDRVLAFVAAWDGRYYWNYPIYKPDRRMGGDQGFRALMLEGRQLGFHMMPMFGTNAANTKLPNWPGIAAAATAKIDGDPMPLNWVDWDNDRHMDGWLAYMNPGVDAWRTWLHDRIADVIERFEPDAYFLDIVGGWTNNTKADMHEGTRRMILSLRSQYPQVAVVGEMHYDALLEFIPMFHAGPGSPAVQKYAHFFQHLSHPAPGRGSSGVHESGFGRWDERTLSLTPTQIPTLNIVDDTFDKYRAEMDAVIQEARRRAGI